MRIVDPRIFENAAQQDSVLVLQLGVHAPRALVRRDRVLLLPSATGVGVEIDTGINTLIHGSDVEPGSVWDRRYRAAGRRLLSETGQCGKKTEQERVKQDQRTHSDASHECACISKDSRQ